MNRVKIFSIVLCSFLLALSLFFPVVTAEVLQADRSNIGQFTVVDRAKMQNQVTLLVNAVNKNRIELVLNLIHKDAAPTLKNNILKALKGKTIQYEQTITSYVQIQPGLVRLEGPMYGQVQGMNITGRKVFFVFSKYGNEWLLMDTNFHTQLTKSNLGTELSKTFMMILWASIPIFILLEIFWIWMLVDLFKRDFTEKGFWIVIVIILNFLGALLYLVTVRRKLKQQERMSGVLFEPIKVNLGPVSPPAQSRQAQLPQQPQQVPPQYRREQVYAPPYPPQGQYPPTQPYPPQSPNPPNPYPGQYPPQTPYPPQTNPQYPPNQQNPNTQQPKPR